MTEVNRTAGTHWEQGDLLLWLQIKPRAGRDRLRQGEDGQWQAAITASPVEGQANLHLAEFLAAEFGVAKSRVRIESGLQSKHKRVRIQQPARLPPGMPPP
jgi:uncharacterized protein (TIGR00251 family)